MKDFMNPYEGFSNKHWMATIRSVVFGTERNFDKHDKGFEKMYQVKKMWYSYGGRVVFIRA